MANLSFKSFNQLLDEIPKLRACDKFDINDYWAHTPSANISNRLPEKLHDHINLVNETCLRLIDMHGLEILINNLIENLSTQLKFEGSKLGNSIKELFFATIVFHDYGKINENFQVERMQNKRFEKSQLSIGCQHSILSAYLFLNYYLDKFSMNPEFKEYQNEVVGVICAFSDCILKHHSSYLDLKEIINNEEIASDLKRFLPFIGKTNHFKYLNQVLEKKLDFQQQVYLTPPEDKNFPLFTLLKLNYSLLTAADYLSTLSYQNNIELPIIENKSWWGILTDKRKFQLFDLFINSEPYNYQALTNPEELVQKSIENYDKKTPDNLNAVRSIILGEVIQNLRNNNGNKLFYLKAPTGAGKTNISLALSIELLSKEKSLNKVFYVFPFTTLITQTYDSITKTLQLSKSEIVQLHSKAEWNKKNEEERLDGFYEADWENHIENLFVHYPFILLSHIKFFDVLKSNKKDTNYLLHRFSNSVVIIDELQSYSPKFWDHVNYFIAHYADALNIRFILMSATLPEIGKLALKSDEKWVNLISNPEKYFRNKNFSGRTKFDFSLLDNDLEVDLNFLSQFIADKGEQYAKKNLGEVKIIIEFIKKKTASEFYQLIVTNKIFIEYSIILLSGTILSPRREEIVTNLKSTEWLKNNHKVLLISTQVVEAGVDIDMDIGFKDTSLIDSDEQLAGRVNRNAKKSNSKVYLFNLNDEDSIYKGDERIEIQRAEIDINTHKEILKSKEFNLLYDKIIEKHLNNRKQLIRKFDEYIEHLQSLRFKNIDDEFKLIEDSSGSVFIPLELKLQVFSNAETDLMKEIEIISEEDKYVSGEKLFQAYENVIKNRTNNFITDRDKVIKFQSLMSKFTISLFQSALDQIQEIERENGNEEPYKFGYLYFSNFTKYYNYEEGLNFLNKNNNAILVI